MTVLLEWKEKLHGFYGKYEAYVLPVIKFLLAAAVFWLITQKAGYMQRLKSVPLLLVLALACSILPVSVMLFAAGVLVTLHCYALSMQAGIIIFALFLMMYLLYFRFAPNYAYNALLMPIASILGIPYVIPAASGLLQHPAAVIPTIFGTVTYYVLKGITANAASLSVSGEKEEWISKFQEILNQFAGDREMFFTAVVFVLVTLIVYIIRRLPMDHAWTIAIIAGMLVQFLAFFAGYMQLGMKNKIVMLSTGCVVSVLILLVIQFFCFNLDYTRTERVQFEDDEYYYYVKAVPKRYVSTREKKVKRISAGSQYKRQRELGKETVTRRELMEDMDIHIQDSDLPDHERSEERM